MTPYWVSPVASLYLGDAAVVLRELPAESVDMCVTSPPFWGLRDYRVDGQIGLEKTPGEWLEHILAVFREVRRVLRPWGVVFVEIGDSYSNDARGGIRPPTSVSLGQDGRYEGESKRDMAGLKPLDLVGIPFRLALALQADGWWLRSVIIWHKPAPMPESVAGWRWIKCKVKRKARLEDRSSEYFQRNVPGIHASPSTPIPAQWADCPGCPKCAPNGGLVLRKGSWRPTEAHSYILMLAKGVPYFANGEAVREQAIVGYQVNNFRDGQYLGGRASKGELWNGHAKDTRFLGPNSGRNLRSVWHIGPEPSSLPHFATFPTALPEKCILAGTSEWGNCPGCGMPWVPIIKASSEYEGKLGKANSNDWYSRSDSEARGHHNDHGVSANYIVLAWRPTCQCGLTDRAPPVVLDPFVGTGTSCVAAQQLGRRSIGVDLNPRYLDMAVTRLGGVPLPLEEVLT